MSLFDSSRPEGDEIERMDGEFSNFRLVTTKKFSERLRACGLDQPQSFADALAAAPETAGGRGPHPMIEDPDGLAAPIRVRRYLRGGVLADISRIFRIAGLARDAFLSPKRAFREFHLWRTVAARGAPLPELVFASAQKRNLFWQLQIATLERPFARDGLEWFQDPAHRSNPAATLIACAKSIRSFHDAGALHGDLNLRNLLFETVPGDPAPEIRCFLIDLAQAESRSALTSRERLKDLMRLLRSAEKEQLAFPRPARAYAQFLSAYCGPNRVLRRALRSGIPQERRRIARHRLGWRVGRGLLPLGIAAILACSGEPQESSVGAESPKPGWSILATGDTGRTGQFAFAESLTEGQVSVAQAMTQSAQREPVDGLLLLGDNFYWRGLDEAHLVERIRRNLVRPYCYFLDLSGPRGAEVDDACGIAPGARRPVPIYAVLGNHDLETEESPRLQRETVPEFLPEWKMSGGIADVFEVAPGISLILFESEVTIRDKVATRRGLLDAIQRAKGPWRIVATHRPIATDDEGGVPLGGYPITVQRTLAEAAAAGSPVQLVLSAHHHNLQAFALDAPAQVLQVGLGAGARAEGPLAHPEHPAARFGALSLGFARISRVGEGPEERLSVSILSAPRWPFLRHFQSSAESSAELARFEVDLKGQSRAIQLSGSRPAD